jgi:sulfite reductase alpha subunit-like flavoprotein
MNKKKPKDLLSQQQYMQQLHAKRDTGLTDSWLKKNGLNPEAVGSVCIEVLQAQQKVHELIARHGSLLNPTQLQLIENFKHRLSDKQKRKKLKPSSAYPILNLCTKIYRLAHRNQMEARLKIQALRNINQ